MVLVFQNAMNGGVAYSSAGVGMWVTDPKEVSPTEGLQFAARTHTARHPADWPPRELGHVQFHTLATKDAECGR
jgi:hypothetical protein